MLWDCLVLSVVALVCCIEITIHSQRFRALLLTLGAINQVSTEAQVIRIKNWWFLANSNRNLNRWFEFTQSFFAGSADFMDHNQWKYLLHYSSDHRNNGWIYAFYLLEE